MQLSSRLKIIGLTLFTSFYSFFSLAEDVPIYSHATKGAIAGIDVVAYFSLQPGEDAVKGSDQYTHQWKGTTWKFSSKFNKQKFALNPEQYAPQYGGYCAFAVGSGRKGFTTDIRPNSWVIIDNKLYLNHNRSSFKLFMKKPEKRIAKADAHWPEVLTVCEKRGNCRK
ncbi:MAG: YHS domain-containing (seleno)protein [Oleispira sp.]